jgi:hypothetical protein
MAQKIPSIPCAILPRSAGVRGGGEDEGYSGEPRVECDHCGKGDELSPTEGKVSVSQMSIDRKLTNL